MRKQSWLWTMLIAGCLIVTGVVLATHQAYFRVAAQEPRVQYGETVEGQIGTVGQTELWQFDGSKGDVITVRVEQTSGTLIPTIALTAPDEVLMVATEAAGETTPFIQFTTSLRVNGQHTITLGGAADTTGAYGLTLTLDEPSTVSADNGTGITGYGRVVSGTITNEVFRQFWAFQGGRGDVIDLRMLATSGDLDGYLSLLSPDGQEVAATDTGEVDGNAALSAIILPSSGTYTIVARRAGAGFGERGDTQGTYDLALDLRTAGVNDTAITPTVMTLGGEARGRLTADAPSALFALSADGVLALNLEFTDPGQVGSVAVMTPDRTLLDTVSGVNPLQTGVSLSGIKEVWIEVSAAGLTPDTELDFSLTAHQLQIAKRAAEPLSYGQPVNILDPFSGPDSWYFGGRAGESVMLSVSPFGPVLNAVVQVTGPNGDRLIDDVIETNWQQAFVLSQDGPYELVLSNVVAAEGYQIQVNRIGVNGYSFEQVGVPQERGMLITGESAEGELIAGGADLWLLSTEEAQEWQLILSHSGRTSPLGLAIQQPDGTPLAIELSSTFASIASAQVTLPSAGVYHVVVFEPGYSTGGDYSLAATPSEGGSLVINTPTKGVLTPANSLNTWHVDLRTGSLLDVQIEALTSNATPTVHVIAPSGQLAGSSLYSEGQESASLTSVHVVRGGSYRIMVTQAGLAQPASYRITVNVTQPLEPDAPILLTNDRPVTEIFTVAPVPTPQPAPVVIADIISPSWDLEQETLAKAQPAELDTLIRGEIAPDTRYQAWTLTPGGPETVSISVTALDGTQRPSLTIVDAEGRVLADALQNQTNINTLAYRFANSGTYSVIVRLADDAGGRYTLWINTQTGLDESLPGMLQGRVMAYGETHIDDIAPLTDGKMYLFYGNKGDVITASVTTLIGDSAPELQLLSSARELLRAGEPSTDQPISLLGDVTLPSDNLYLLIVMPPAEQQSTGRYALYLSVKQAAVTSELEGGPLSDTQISALSAGNSTHRWFFDAQAGERVTIQLDPLSSGAPSPLALTLTDTTGSAFLHKEAELGQSALVFDQVLLPRSGIYQVVVSGGQRIDGGYRLSLLRDTQRIQDSEGALCYGETEGKVLTRDNYLDVWTLAGSRGDVVSVTARVVRGDTSFLSMQIRAYTGQVLGTTAVDPNTGTSHLDSIVLPFDGHYSIIVGNPDGTFAGETAYEISARLNDTPARSMGTVIAYGETREGRFYVDDGSDTWLFEGQQADMVSITLEAQASTIAPSLSLVSTDWQTPVVNALPDVFGSVQALADQPAHFEFQLPVSGTYAIYLQNAGGGSGSYRLSVDQTSGSTIQTRTLVSGLAQTGEIGDTNAVEVWTFAGSQSDVISLRVIPDDRADLAPVIEVFDPNHSLLARAEALPASEATVKAVVLPATGSYRVRITRALGDTGETHGRYTVQLDAVTSAEPAMQSIGYNQMEAGTLGNGVISEWWSFDGRQGQMIRVRAETTSGTLDPVVRLYDSAGGLLAEGDDRAGSTNAELLYSLLADNTYRIQVLRRRGALGTSQGNYSLTVESIYQFEPIQPSQIVSYGDRVSGSTDNQQPDETWVFAGQAGDIIQAKIQFPTDDAPLTLTLHDPAGNELAVGVRDRGDVRLDAFTLPATGFYMLEVHRPADARSAFNPYTLDLTLLTVADTQPAQGGFLALDQNITGQFDGTQDSHTWAFEGQASTPVSLMISRLDGPLALNITLFAPDGTSLFATSTLAGTTNALTSDPILLPVDGVYLLVITRSTEAVPETRYRLSIRSLNDAAAVVQTLTPTQDGTGTLNALHPSDRWQFAAQAGDVVSLWAAVTAGDLQPQMVIMGPAGIPLVEGLSEQTGTDGQWQTVVDQVILPQTGSYTVLISRKDSTNGQYRLMLRTNHISPQAVLAKDIAYDQVVQTTVTSSSEVIYAVQGAEGDVIGLAVHKASGEVRLMVQTEAGTDLLPAVQSGQGEVIVPALVLPESGRYLITVALAEAGPLDLVVFRRTTEAPQGGTVRVLSRNQTLAEGILTSAQVNQWNFTGSAGEVLTFTVDTTGSGLRADLALYGPTGYMASVVEEGDTRATQLGPIRFPADGDYRLIVRSWLGASSGSYTINAETAEAGISGSNGGYLAAPDGIGYGGLIAEDAQDVWIFDGSAGEIISVRAEQTLGNGTLTLMIGSADGSWTAAGLTSTAFTGAEINETVLPADGRYSLTVSGQVNPGEAVEYRLGVIRVQSSIAARLRTAQGLNYGDQRTGTLYSEAAQAWTFYGQRGETIRSVIQPSTPEFVPVVYLVDPQGNIAYVVTGDKPGEVVELQNVTLTDDGFYGLVVNEAQPSTHEEPIEFSISLERLDVRAVLQGQLAFGSADALLTASAPLHSWELLPAFSGSYRISVKAQVPGAMFSLAIQNLDGTAVIPADAPSEAAEVTVQLTGGERYTAVIAGGAALRQGHYTIELEPASVKLDGGSLVIDQPDTGLITVEDFTDTWQITVDVTASLAVVVDVVDDDLVLIVSLYDSAGTLVAEQTGIDAQAIQLSVPAGGGNYTVLVARDGGAAGRTSGQYTITLEAPTN